MAPSRGDKSDHDREPQRDDLAPEGKGKGNDVQISSSSSPLSPLPPASNSSAPKPSKSALSRKPQLSSASSGPSPKPSRESSPARPRTKSIGSSKTSPHRRGSQDSSPARAPAKAGGENQPSSSVVRKLSSTNIPALPASTSSSAHSPAPGARSRQLAKEAAEEGGRHWPTSPRLKSPPPSSNKAVAGGTTPRRQEGLTASSTPNIVIQSSTPVDTPSPLPTPPAPAIPDAEGEDQLPLASGMRTPIRSATGITSTLETVQEGSLPNTPNAKSQLEKALGDSKSDHVSELSSDGDKQKDARASLESGAESSGTRSDEQPKKPTTSVVKPPSISRSSTSLASKTIAALSSRGKASGELSGNNMTVEAETVSSIPQVALGGGGPAERNISKTDGSGTVRLKPSSETIRPKKEKKKAVRKAPSLNSGTASSKADIFEAKVASAVDEADSSDSDETFVYESNPPESHASRSNRYHSRTPSVTSMQSYADHRSGIRPGAASTDAGQTAVGGKKNMKFANPSYASSGVDADVSDRAELGRSGGVGSTRGNATGVHNQKRINTHGRTARNGHISLLDPESPFPGKNRTATGTHSRQSSRPASPRNLIQRMGGNGKNSPFTTYDMDVEGDDEQTPLMGALRPNRTRNARRYGGTRHGQAIQTKQRGVFTRFMACLLISVLVILLLVGAFGFVIATTRPLSDVKLRQIENVLASEQQIIMDLVVEAVNPNILSVAISDMDVNIFARSSYVGSDRFWRAHPQLGTSRRAWDSRKRHQLITPSSNGSDGSAIRYGGYRPGDGVDDGTDPPDDWPGKDSETMLLGEIYQLDSSLVFPGSPFKHQNFNSSGELKLRKPGNKTEAGGTERWERVLEHKFTLIVRGVLKYQLPFSGHTYSSTIRGNVTINPDSSVKKGKVYSTEF